MRVEERILGFQISVICLDEKISYFINIDVTELASYYLDVCFFVEVITNILNIGGTNIYWLYHMYSELSIWYDPNKLVYVVYV